MKYFLTTFCLILFCSTALANPFYQEGKNVVRNKEVYTYNIKLFKQLEDDYRKRCWVETPTSFNNICGTGSYQEQVLGTYFRNKKEY